MSRILVLYGTTDGQTAKIARVLGDELIAAGAQADVANAASALTRYRPDDYAGVIVAASVHASGYQHPVERWVRTHHAALATRPNVFVSVCLGVLEKKPEVDRALNDIMQKFFGKTGWTPGVTHIVAGALPYSRYNVLKRWMMRRIVARAGGDTDTSRDYEYTDWEDVKHIARTFAAGVANTAVASA